MPKRSRVRRETILDALEEEEIVAEAQPELATAEDESGRPTKKQKREHYRLLHCLCCRSRAREREVFPPRDARLLPIDHEVAKRDNFFCDSTPRSSAR